jgi:hypothetical protein
MAGLTRVVSLALNRVFRYAKLTDPAFAGSAAVAALWRALAVRLSNTTKLAATTCPPWSRRPPRIDSTSNCFDGTTAEGSAESGFALPTPATPNAKRQTPNAKR